jgi:hypothetical protein
MKFLRCFFVFGLAVAVATLVYLPSASAQPGYGMHRGMWGGGGGYEQGDGWSYCPYCGSGFQGRGGYDSPYGGQRGPGMMGPGYGGRHMGPGMMGPGMMGPGYGGRHMGPGMMGPGYDRGYGRYGYPEDRRWGGNREPLEEDEAKAQVEQMLTRSRNPNLKLGEVEEKDDFFQVDILTKGGELVDRMQVDKQTGMMRSIY